MCWFPSFFFSGYYKFFRVALSPNFFGLKFEITSLECSFYFQLLTWVHSFIIISKLSSWEFLLLLKIVQNVKTRKQQATQGNSCDMKIYKINCYFCLFYISETVHETSTKHLAESAIRWSCLLQKYPGNQTEMETLLG